MMNSMVLLAQDSGGSLALIWGLLLFGAAVGLLFLEVFFPSGGILAIMTGVATIASIVAFFQHSTTAGLLAILGYLILGPILIVFAFKVWLNSPVAKHLILGAADRAPGEEGEQTDEAAAYDAEMSRLERLDEMRALMGLEGEAVTSLRPVGTVKIQGRRIDALAEGTSIEAGTPVVVVDVYDNQVKVRPR